METIELLLESGRPIILDGAMGTLLMEAGLDVGTPGELWNLLYPDRIITIHQAYVDAGAQIILSNSFGANAIRNKFQTDHSIFEINRAAAANARCATKSAPYPVFVAGSMGPTGQLLQPLGTLSRSEALAAFEEQSRGLASGGVDLFWLETMSDLTEVEIAIESIRRHSQLPIVATLTFDTKGRTMMGVKPSQAAAHFEHLDLIAYGSNCGNGPDEMLDILDDLISSNPTKPIVLKSNAGLPKLHAKQIIYEATPTDMAENALKAYQLGANLIGGCCGTRPEHIQEMAIKLNKQ